MSNLAPPKDVEAAKNERNNLLAELDTSKVPLWRSQEINVRLLFLRGYLVGKGEFHRDNLEEKGNLEEGK